MMAALCGCGTPGAPQLPSLQLARPVEDLSASRTGNRVELEWTLPRRNTDRTLVTHPLATRICRHEGTALMSACSAIGEMSPRSPQPKQKTESQPETVRVHYQDVLPLELENAHPASFVTYAVEEVNTRGRSAGLSNQVAVPLAPTLPPPEDLRAELSADGVRIVWSGPPPPTPQAGLQYLYQIDRKPAGAPAYLVVGNAAPSEGGSYLDKTFEWQKKYEYRITTVTAVHAEGIQASVPGDSTKPVEVFTRDIYPPGAPTGLQAVFSSVGQKPFIDLTWAPNSESDVAGYNVFRRSGNGQLEKLNRELVPVPAFRDDSVQPGLKYVYVVSAVDLRGNESARSAEASESAGESNKE